MANAKALWSEQAWVPKAAGSEGPSEGGASPAGAPWGMTAFAESWAMTLMISEPQATRSSLEKLALETDRLCGVI